MTELDPEALRRRYAAEREKRLRPDGNAQYIEISGRFARWLDDPYSKPAERAPIEDDSEIIVIGGGFGGLLAAARLREQGFSDIRMIEKAGDFGGTWYWNRYPGAACDVDAYIYLPLLEELGFMPARKYATAREILAYCRLIGEHFDLYRNASFHTQVTELRWDEATLRWTVSTNRGDRMRARFVAMANGPAHKPKLPGIPGIEDFAGHAFHTTRWDYAYTGGGPEGGLERLYDKKVGVIGTGATAVQCIPHLGRDAGHLTVFQRTPSTIDVRNDRPTDLAWWRDLKPGWQRERMENFTITLSGGNAGIDLVKDGWTDATTKYLRLNSHSGTDAGTSREAVERADFAKMEEIRARVDASIDDPVTADALKPWYRQFCKRPCFHDEFLPTFNRPNVTLVDTGGKGVERITERGVVVAGVEYALDCLVFATGFELGTNYTKRSGYDVIGVDGLRLSAKWADGLSSLHGMHVHGFPNLFVFMRDQSAHTPNFTHALDEQAIHLARLLGQVRARDGGRVEVTAGAEAGWVRTIMDLAEIDADFFAACTPGYYNAEGQMRTEAALRNAGYGAGPMAFFKLLAEWREAGRLEGLDVR